jgi:4-aminobutyrate aminotransferase / (S)-3-amino-2-methylpropionate transaminase / 5-aminovalerate transaminase
MAVHGTDIEQRRLLLTEIPGPRSKELHDRRVHAVSAGLTVGLPAYIDRAEGAILVDVDGNHLIDLGAGIAVTSVGHAVPEVTDAISAQAARFNHTCFMVTPYEGYVEVAEALNRLTPGDHDKRTALFNSGAEAVENAVKIARLATGRQAVVVVEHAYHGRTNLTMALTAKNMPYKDRFGPFAPEVYRVATSYPYRDGLDGPEAARRAIASVESTVGAGNVAAVLIEPIQGEGGFIVPAPGFLSDLSAWCTKNGALFIADEIQTGFCRTGAWFACNHEGVVPDLVTTAKGIAAGMPLAGVTGRTDVMDAVHEGGLGGTYGGNPVAAAAAIAAIEVMRRDELAARAIWIGEYARQRLDELALASPIVGEVRGRGAMIGVEFVEPGTTAPNAAAVKAVVAACAREGVVVLSCGTYGNVLRLLPSLSIAEALLDDGLAVLESAVHALTG